MLCMLLPLEASSKEGYRALPSKISHPISAKKYTKLEVADIDKIEMQIVGSTTKGHKKTTVWYSPKILKSYLLQIEFTSHPTVYVQSITTYTPTLGMDKIDGAFAEDVEAQVIYDVLGYMAP